MNCNEINEEYNAYIEYLNKKDKKLRLLSNFEVDFEDLDLNF